MFWLVHILRVMSNDVVRVFYTTAADDGTAVGVDCPKETKEAAVGASYPKELSRNCEAAAGAFGGEVEGCSNKES